MCKVTVSTYDFFKKFPNEEAARLHLEQKRWHGEPVCPKCGCIENQYKQKRDGKEGYSSTITARLFIPSVQVRSLNAPMCRCTNGCTRSI
jgi:hypothetical protein